MVIIDLSLDKVQSSRYCYTISASNESTRVFVTGTRIRGNYAYATINLFVRANSSHSFSNGSQGGPDVAAIAVGVVLGIVLVILLIAASALIIILIVKYSSLTRKYDATGELHINAVLVTD